MIKTPPEFLRQMLEKKLDIPRFHASLRPEAISARVADHINVVPKLHHWPVETYREFRDKLESDLADAVKRQDWQTVAIIARNLDRIDNPNRPEHTSQI